MTNRYERDAFEKELDAAIAEMHGRLPRGERPSEHVWGLIEAQGKLGNVRSEVPQHSEQIAIRGTNLGLDHPNVRASDGISRATSHLSWSTWVAAMLIVAVLGASFYYWQPQEGDPDFSNSIALAPGTPAMTVLELAERASPSASPSTHVPYIPVYGPEFACMVEPLTDEQVYQIVLNPGSPWLSKDSSRNPYDFGLSENPDRWSDVQWESQARSSYVPVDEPEVTQPIVEAANTFWNCIMTGSAKQVWALMDPVVVQHEILRQHPVLRDEAMLREHIASWGNRKYSASLYHAFPDLGNTPPYEASRVADQSYGSIRMGYDSDGQPWKAVVSMVSHPNSQGFAQNDILLLRAPDGSWWVSAIFYED